MGCRTGWGKCGRHVIPGRGVAGLVHTGGGGGYFIQGLGGRRDRKGGRGSCVFCRDIWWAGRGGWVGVLLLFHECGVFESDELLCVNSTMG